MAWRILALALVLESEDRATAVKTCGMDRQTLRDWVHRYNVHGLAGLANRKRVGRPPKLNAEQKEAFWMCDALWSSRRVAHVGLATRARAWRRGR